MDFKKYTNRFDFIFDSERFDQEEARIYEQFRQDALVEVGILNHPMADELYSLAWKFGHIGGLPEVFTHLKDYVGIYIDNKENGV